MAVDEMKEKLISALLIGETENSERARFLAEKYQNCPYIYFIATEENKLFAIYFLPVKQRWWIETIEKKPRDTIGLEKAEVTFVNNVYYPEKLMMRLPEKPIDISPCGSYCRNCPYYGKCSGCPATTFFRK